MNTFADVVYPKFFLRDVLGKIVPGCIVCLTVLDLSGLVSEDVFLTWEPSSWVLGLMELGMLYLAGFALQVAGELIGFLSARPKPHHVLLIPVGALKRSALFAHWWQINEDYAERSFRITSTPQQIDVKIIEQREYSAL